MSERRVRNAVRAWFVPALLLALLVGAVGAHVHEHDSDQLCRHCEEQRAVDLPGRIGLDVRADCGEQGDALTVPALARRGQALGALSFRGPPVPSP